MGRLEAIVALVDEALVITALVIVGVYAGYAAGLIDADTAVLIGGFVAVAVGVVVYLVARAHSRRPGVGPEALIGEVGEAVEDLDPEGMVLVEGELWRARARGGRVRRGEKVRVVEVDGLTLVVERADSTP